MCIHIDSFLQHCYIRECCFFTQIAVSNNGRAPSNTFPRNGLHPAHYRWLSFEWFGLNDSV